MTTPPANPTTRGEILAESILACKLLLGRYLVGFNDVTHVRQTPDLPNHVAWCLGHCAHTMHRVAEKFDGKPLPASDFITGDGTNGSRDRGYFDTEAVRFGSVPEDRHDRFPRLERSTEIYNQACDRLATAVSAAPESMLDEVVPWGQGTTPLRQLVLRMIFHNGIHAGQIADLRRALSFKSIFS
jgi:hypothetical protein